METLIEHILGIITTMHDAWLYLFLFFSSVLENLFPPVPGDTITVFGAFLVGAGRLNFAIVLAVTTVGSATGFLLLYMFGAFLEREFFIEKDYRFFSAKSIIAAEEWFRKYGYYVVAANRFLPGIRSVISLASGISGLSPMKVFLYCNLSAVVWNFIWIYTGYTLGNNWNNVKEKFLSIAGSYNTIAGIFLAIVIIFIVIKRLKNNNRRESA
ncbi:MAG TPA: DedA family protein [Spirochaetota bacterium]|nr:DedA family protein [Spirochaetota bacterium]